MSTQTVRRHALTKRWKNSTILRKRTLSVCRWHRRAMYNWASTANWGNRSCIARQWKTIALATKNLIKILTNLLRTTVSAYFCSMRWIPRQTANSVAWHEMLQPWKTGGPDNEGLHDVKRPWCNKSQDLQCNCRLCYRVLRDVNLQLMNRGYVNPEQAVPINEYRLCLFFAFFSILYFIMHDGGLQVCCLVMNNILLLLIYLLKTMYCCPDQSIITTRDMIVNLNVCWIYYMLYEADKKMFRRMGASSYCTNQLLPLSKILPMKLRSSRCVLHCLIVNCHYNLYKHSFVLFNLFDKAY